MKWRSNYRQPPQPDTSLPLPICPLESGADLSAQARTLQSLFNAIDESAGILDRDGTVLAVNETFAARLGRTVSSCIGQSIYSFVPADVANTRRAFVDQVLKTCRPIVFEDERQGLWLHHSLFPILGTDGTVERIALFARDITKHKTSEAVLKASEAKFKAIANYTVNWESWFGPDGRYLWVNPAVERFTGYSPEEILAMPDFVETLIAPEDRAVFYERFREAIQGTRGEGFEFRYLHKNGSKHWLSASWQPIFDEAGHSLGVRSSGKDISERKRLETYRDMGQEVLQILNEPGDLKSSIQRVIATLKTRTGFDAVGIRLQNDDDFPYFAQQGLSADFLMKENSLIARNSDGGVCRDANGRIALECTCGLVLSGKTDPANPLFTPGGSCWLNDSSPLLDLPQNQDPRLHPRNQCIHEGYASVALIPIRNKEGIVGLIHLNDRRKGCFTRQTIDLLEGIAAHLGAALMRKLAETERENLQAQLAQARKMESVGRLAGGVAHDFNNLLMGILGYTELCRDAIGPHHPIRDWLDEITRGAERSANLTRQLLAFARKQVIAPETVDLNEAVSGMLKMIQRLLREDIELIWKPGSTPLKVKMDPSQLDQILVNLIVNARDAMPGVGQLTLETQGLTLTHSPVNEPAEGLPGPYVQLKISDTGCGMNPETLSHIFEPFFTTKGVGKETGRGLATVYGIVKQNRGYITVDSRLGEGTTFTLFLPRQPADAGETPRATNPAVCPPGTETILLAEDEDSVRFTVELFLKSLGYQVLVGPTPQDVLRQATEYPGPIHLLITDVIMPGMNGRDLAQRLMELRPTLKCLYMSGYPSEVIAHHGILDPGIKFLAKPFTRQDLAHTVRKILDSV